MDRLWRAGGGLLLLLILIILTYTTSVQAADIKVAIDGQSRYFETPVQIANNRVMVPIRFVIEDPALQGKVYWDNSLKKVAIDCRGKYVELFIGSLQALVDGKAVQIDSAPYIYNNRTYIPLRFLTENLGAQVSWDSYNREVSIAFAYQFRVMPYYYLPARDELTAHAGVFTDIAFRWFKTNGRGELDYEYRDNYAEMIELARSKGLKTQASVVLMGEEELHQLLSIGENRALLIGNIMERVKNDGYDGVNIDFELMGADDASSFTTFLRELKTALGDKTLSVAVFARTARDKWPTPYQYSSIGQIADQVVVMAYDYHYRTSAPGPVAPLWWVEDVVDYMCSQMPARKVLLGLPTYGYDWGGSANGTSVTAKKLADLKESYTLVEEFDQASMSPSYNYWDQYGVWHQVWLENEQSLQAKLNLAQTKKLGGISFWRIGTGFTDLYKVLE